MTTAPALARHRPAGGFQAAPARRAETGRALPRTERTERGGEAGIRAAALAVVARTAAHWWPAPPG